MLFTRHIETCTDAPWMGFVKGRRTSEPADVVLVVRVPFAHTHRSSAVPTLFVV